METLTDTDLDWLTTVENKLIRLRKREAANANRCCKDITGAIEMDIHNEELEAVLKRGGFSEDQYEYTELVGVEIRGDSKLN